MVCYLYTDGDNYMHNVLKRMGYRYTFLFFSLTHYT